MQKAKARFMAGKVIFKEGAFSDKAYLVETGKVRLVKSQDGRELVLESVGPKGIFGEMSLIDGSPRSATAIAEADTVCIPIDEQEFQKRIKETDPFLRGIFRILVARLRGTTERLSTAPSLSQMALEVLGSSRSYRYFPQKEQQANSSKSTTSRLQNLQDIDQRIENMGNDLLYFARLGTLDLTLQEVNPNHVIRDIEKALQPFLKEYNAHIVMTAPMPLTSCDKKMITEIFRNLIMNAVQYNEAKERTVEIGFLKHIDTPHGKENDVFYVKDNGVGIAPEFQDSIFHLFKRLHHPAGANELGIGMGLALVERIIGRHKGRVWLESAPGKGSTFYFTIP